MHRISLGNDLFEGENNAYLFTDGPTTLVDTGIADRTTRSQLTDGLADHGVTLADIDRVLLTHYHADHSGLVGEIQAAGGADVYVHEADAALAAEDDDAWDELFTLYERRFEEWGMPDAERQELLSYLQTADDSYGDPATVERFTDGARFDVGESTLEAIHAPGHTAGLSCFVTGETVLTGDAVLPVYTPNVGGADVRVTDPLATYLDTLEHLAAREFDRAWPGHRDPIDDPSARARHIIAHHEERALRVLRALERRGAADPWTVSADLFGDLDGIHVLHGPGEAYAHLDHLHDTGAVTVTDGEYALAADTADRLETHEGDRWSL